jgi:hypothetical protein
MPSKQVTGSFGFGAPRDTPAEIIEKLNQEINAGLADPRMKARIADLGYTVFESSPTDFNTFVAAFTEKWGQGDQVLRRENLLIGVLFRQPGEHFNFTPPTLTWSCSGTCRGLLSGSDNVLGLS